METEVLGRLPYFSQLPAKELELVSSSVQSLPLARGNILFNEGEPSRGLYFVVEGAIKVSRISPEGREQVLTVVGGTQTFNEVPVFDGGPCPATAAASWASSPSSRPGISAFPIPSSTAWRTARSPRY